MLILFWKTSICSYCSTVSFYCMFSSTWPIQEADTDIDKVLENLTIWHIDQYWFSFLNSTLIRFPRFFFFLTNVTFLYFFLFFLKKKSISCHVSAVIYTDTNIYSIYNELLLADLSDETKTNHEEERRHWSVMQLKVQSNQFPVCYYLKCSNIQHCVSVC